MSFPHIIVGLALVALVIWLRRKPVDNPPREEADAVRFCGWFRFPCEEPPADFANNFSGSVPTPAALTTFHEERSKL